MKISTQRLHNWFQAIRNSNDKNRTLDAFYRGQILSKEWLIEHSSHYITNNCTITIYGGWVGVLAGMLFESFPNIKNITSIDIDPSCEKIAIQMNQDEYNDGKFIAITTDMEEYTNTSDIVINTSCEHITQEKYNKWLSNISTDSILFLQSNNYRIEEHIRIATSLDEFIKQSHIRVTESATLELPLYNRYMLIGKKFV